MCTKYKKHIDVEVEKPHFNAFSMILSRGRRMDDGDGKIIPNFLLIFFYCWDKYNDHDTINTGCGLFQWFFLSWNKKRRIHSKFNENWKRNEKFLPLVNMLLCTVLLVEEMTLPLQLALQSITEKTGRNYTLTFWHTFSLVSLRWQYKFWSKLLAYHNRHMNREKLVIITWVTISKWSNLSASR